jgi:hypothetical protein
MSTKDQGEIASLVVEKYAKELADLAIITAGKDKVRIRK